MLLALDLGFPQEELINELFVIFVIRVEFTPLVRLVVSRPVWAQLERKEKKQACLPRLLLERKRASSVDANQ